MYAPYHDHRNRIMRRSNRSTTSRRQGSPDSITVAGIEYQNASNSAPSRATNGSRDSLQLSQETLDEHMRSQSRFDEQIYLRLHALEGLIDKMLNCIEEVHQRNEALEKCFREIRDRVRDATVSADPTAGQSSDTFNEVQSSRISEQTLARVLAEPIHVHLREKSHDTSSHQQDQPPDRSTYVDAPERHHADDEIFTELQAFAKMFNEGKLPKLSFPNGSVQQARQDDRDY